MTLDSFLPFILPEVQGCPTPLINQHLVQSAIYFCSESKSWTEIKAPITLIDNQSDYVIAPPADAYTEDFREVWLGARRLRPKTMAELQLAIPDWQTSYSNEPVFYNQANVRGSITVYPKPMNSNGAAIVVRAVYVPTASATTLPDFLYERFLAAIAAGAKASLMLMPNQLWSNPQMGAYYKAIHENGTDDARITELHDRVTGTVSVPYRTFGF